MNPALLPINIEIRCTKIKTIMNAKNPRTFCFLGHGHTNKPTGKLKITKAKTAAKTPPINLFPPSASRVIKVPKMTHRLNNTPNAVDVRSISQNYKVQPEFDPNLCHFHKRSTRESRSKKGFAHRVLRSK